MAMKLCTSLFDSDSLNSTAVLYWINYIKQLAGKATSGVASVGPNLMAVKS